MKRTFAMALQTRKFSASLSFLFLALSWSLGSAVDGAPSKRLRGETSTRDEPEPRRELAKKNKKAKGADRRSPVSERMIVRCKPQISDENCLEQLSSSGENLDVIHSLPSLHSFAIEGDLATWEDLERMGIDVFPDYERVPLVLDDAYHRNLDATPYGVGRIRADQVWDQYGVTGEGVKICVIDTGVQASHPDFLDSNLSGYDGETRPLFDNPWDVDTRGHGTHVTGIIASTNDEDGYVGVAPGAEVYMINPYNANGRFFSSDILAALQVCQDVGANIVSLSAGGTGFEEAEQEAFNRLYDDGILTVAAAGNSYGSDTIYPAAYDKVISVAASNEADAIADFSTVNSFTNIAAPGVAIRSASNTGGHIASTGTSTAAPHVAGVLALLLEYRRSLSPQDLTTAILSSSRDSSGPRNVGIIDALSAIQLVESGLPEMAFDGECIPIDLEVTTDRYGSETAYRLQTFPGGEELWFGVNLRSRREYRESACLDPALCYQFDIRDAYGDGIIAPGGIRLTYNGDEEYSGGGYGRGFYRRYGNC